ncbi:hypothetical protein ENSA5_62200 [Enhygromyxa salina]|uniref:Uncharacterized protein n=1 Tax=Enhygromyxa salina TaxID=215803 RepID=A0A2S9XD44_9BACT|nr:hypothetical protein [Enhygromyxa salina]PRP90786.1 hypothetical protein ENSA5_62200 [Enhygromyxa salina]
MNFTQEEKHLQRAETLIAKWECADAMVWKHQRSHQGIVLRLSKEEQEGCLLLYLGDVSWYTGPLRWKNAALEATRIHSADSDSKYLLKDETAGLVVRFAVLEAHQMTEKYPK